MSIKPKVDGYNESKSGHGSQPSPKGLWLGSTLMRWSSWMLLSQPHLPPPVTWMGCLSLEYRMRFPPVSSGRQCNQFLLDIGEGPPLHRPRLEPRGVQNTTFSILLHPFSKHQRRKRKDQFSMSFYLKNPAESVGLQCSIIFPALHAVEPDRAQCAADIGRSCRSTLRCLVVVRQCWPV